MVTDFATMRKMLRPLASGDRLWGDDGRMNDKAPEADRFRGFVF